MADRPTVKAKAMKRAICYPVAPLPFVPRIVVPAYPGRVALVLTIVGGAAIIADDAGRLGATLPAATYYLDIRQGCEMEWRLGAVGAGVVTIAITEIVDPE